MSTIEQRLKADYLAYCKDGRVDVSEVKMCALKNGASIDDFGATQLLIQIAGKEKRITEQKFVDVLKKFIVFGWSAFSNVANVPPPLPQITTDFTGFFSRAVSIARTGSTKDKLEMLTVLSRACLSEDVNIKNDLLAKDIFSAVNPVLTSFPHSFLKDNLELVNEVYMGFHNLIDDKEAACKLLNSNLCVFLTTEYVHAYNESFLYTHNFSNEDCELNHSIVALNTPTCIFITCTVQARDKLGALLAYNILPTCINILRAYCVLFAERQAGIPQLISLIDNVIVVISNILVIGSGSTPGPAQASPNPYALHFKAVDALPVLLRLFVLFSDTTPGAGVALGKEKIAHEILDKDGTHYRQRCLLSFAIACYLKAAVLSRTAKEYDYASVVAVLRLLHSLQRLAKNPYADTYEEFLDDAHISWAGVVDGEKVVKS